VSLEWCNSCSQYWLLVTNPFSHLSTVRKCDSDSESCNWIMGSTAGNVYSIIVAFVSCSITLSILIWGPEFPVGGRPPWPPTGAGSADANGVECRSAFHRYKMVQSEAYLARNVVLYIWGQFEAKEIKQIPWAMDDCACAAAKCLIINNRFINNNHIFHWFLYLYSHISLLTICELMWYVNIYDNRCNCILQIQFFCKQMVPLHNNGWQSNTLKTTYL